MSVKQNTRSLKAALSVPLIFPAGDADAVAEIQDLYGYLRQRAAEKPLQTRMLSRASMLSKDEKKRWREFGERKRSNLIAMVDTLISDLESVPTIDSLKKLCRPPGALTPSPVRINSRECPKKLPTPYELTPDEAPECPETTTHSGRF